MPTFKYLGLTKTQKENMIATHMAPLEDDEHPHPRFGGFPLPESNEIGFYDRDGDKPKMVKDRAAKRDAYRKQRLEELQKKMADQDAMMVFTVGRQPGKPNSGERIEFLKGKPVDVRAGHVKLVAKLRALCGQEVTKMKKNGDILFKGVVVAEPFFEEIKPKG